MLNRYKKRSHISAKKFREIIRYFSLDFTTTNTANLTKISRNSVNKIYDKIRKRILLIACGEQEKISGEFELDESYFGAKRVRGKRGRGAAGKTPVFGLLKRDGKVFVQIVKNCTRAELMPIIQGKILEGSTINTDGWKAYDGLILNGYNHYRVYHSALSIKIVKSAKSPSNCSAILVPIINLTISVVLAAFCVLVEPMLLSCCEAYCMASFP
jgi:transposase